MIFTDAKSVIQHLYALPILHPKNDLSYIRKVLAKLGDPQNDVKTIHVTGTNGKGSTSYYLSNLLKKAGQKTGLFVSPYIRAFNERIQINGEFIPDENLVKLANQVEKVIDELRKSDPDFSLVTFEYEVALAFLYFSKEKCDYTVIEVGIGGKHDKTNVIYPELSIITTIGLDHEKIIGPTIEDIAKEKSGVIKANSPVVLGNISDNVLSILEAKAKKENSSVYLLQRDFKIKNSCKLEYSFQNRKLEFNHRPEVEEYDIAIATTAFLLLDLPLSSKDLEAAINATVIPGRYQLIEQHPDIILDGAHNIQAMNNLLNFVRKSYANVTRIKVLIAMMKDKDLEKVFSLFKNEEVTLTSIPYPRAAKLDDFPKDVQTRYPYVKDYQKAFRLLQDDLKDDEVLLVTGSFYLVSGILNMEDKDES
ncbi:bifunctional folylpolyglutamate synthase/dihydrofolate synthase [Lactobacillus agrestimuris]|uniref:bifunctional folylpolyglutamate synthase/dihydrofolate synthase n=1 Tax=Lactobacillus agrestimuris TaxID=2941328 RepID=UPI002042D7A0|nr:folylpolyglutamate synthase/dihydrofolate synthase family protein [Lactobacillus agrestimuris]